MNSVVVSPSISDFYFTPSRSAALGAISVNNQLLKYNINSTVLNLPLLSPRGKTIPIPSSFNYLIPYIIPGERGSVSFFNKYKNYGPNIKESTKLILSYNPDIIFISLFAWAYATDLITLTKELKKELGRNNNIIIAVGGPGVSVYPEYFKDSDLFDYIITGEAEIVIPSFINEIKSKIKDFSNSTYLFGKDNYRPVINNKNPLPLLSLKKDSKGNQWISTILSRGCPLRCKFCSNHLTQGRIFRSTSLLLLSDEIKKLDIDYGSPVHINLEDDNLLIRKKYFIEALELFKVIIPNVSFSIDNGLDYTYLSIEFVNKLIDLGFNSFTFSLGSSDLNILKQEERPGDFKKLEILLNHIKKKNIPVKTFFICGLPEDTPLSIIRTLIYLHGLKTDSGISMFYPVPGLPHFEDKNLFKNINSNLCCGSSTYPWAKSLTTEEMVTVFRLSRLSNLVNRNSKSDNEILLLNKIKNENRLFTFYGKEQKIIPVPNMNRYLVEEFLLNIKVNTKNHFS